MDLLGSLGQSTPHRNRAPPLQLPRALRLHPAVLQPRQPGRGITELKDLAEGVSSAERSATRLNKRCWRMAADGWSVGWSGFLGGLIWTFGN